MQDNNTTQFSILCVDDEQGVLESYLHVLTGKGDVLSSLLQNEEQESGAFKTNSYRLLLAESGEKALEIVRKEKEKGNQIAAGFFDIRMPGGMDGYETIKQIRTIDPEMYCAVVTAYTDRNPDQIRKLFSPGYEDHFLYFNKPFSTVELEQTALFLTTAWERKRKEERMFDELRQAKNDWEDVFNTIDEAITIHDLDYNILRSNSTSQYLLQKDAGQISNSKCYYLYHGQNSPPEDCPTCRTAKTGIPSMSQFYEPHLRKYVELKALPRFDKEDKLCGIIHVAKDITEQKKAEKDLLESEERFREMAELLPVALFEMDMHTNLTFANKCAFDYFGYNQDDLKQGMTALDLIVPEDKEKAQKNLSLIANGAESPLNEYEALKKNGETFPVVIRTSMIIRDNKQLGFRGVIIDVSEKKRLESRIFQSQKKEAIGTLAGGIAHDFNNILTGIMGYTELVLMKTDKKDFRYGYISEILKGGKRAAKLVKQILTFSRQDEAELKPIKIIPVINEAIKLLRATIPTTIDIQQGIQPECEDALLMADQTQLHQIVMNVCTNAFHAMRKSGGILKIEISITNLKEQSEAIISSSLSPGNYLKISISDTGQGMDTKVVSRIFEPYFTTKKRGEGTGLGLAVTYGIVKKHKGDIVVESTIGEGTSFDIYLPTVEAILQTETEQIDYLLPPGSGNILFIDDESTIVQINSRALESAGYTVKGYTSSSDALSEFSVSPDFFDLVITDMTMPKMDGAEISTKMLKIRPDIPIIMCTGFSENITTEKAQELGIRKLLHKPVPLMDMAYNIRQLINEKSTIKHQ